MKSNEREQTIKWGKRMKRSTRRKKKRKNDSIIYVNDNESRVDSIWTAKYDESVCDDKLVSVGHSELLGNDGRSIEWKK